MVWLFWLLVCLSRHIYSLYTCSISTCFPFSVSGLSWRVSLSGQFFVLFSFLTPVISLFVWDKASSIHNTTTLLFFCSWYFCGFLFFFLFLFLLLFICLLFFPRLLQWTNQSTPGGVQSIITNREIKQQESQQQTASNTIQKTPPEGPGPGQCMTPL